MLDRWLAPLDVATFRELHLGQPYARPGAAACAVPLLGWETFERVLRSELPLDVLTVSAGALVDVAPPRSLASLRALMSAGVSVVVRSSERNDSDLAAVAASFAEALPGGEVHIQLYATPAGTNAYGWHYDFEDVFIVQTAGIKDYYFRQNTVARHTVLGDQLDFSGARRERSPLYSARLLPGDWLYIPARWWHLVRCLEDSLSISVGAMPQEAFRNARRIPRGWSGAPAPVVPAAAVPTPMKGGNAMGLMDDIGNILGRYRGDSSASSEDEVHRDFDRIATHAQPHDLAGGLAATFRSEKTPPFADMLGQMFAQASGPQRAGLLNTLFAALAASPVVSRGLERPVTPEEAEQVSPEAARSLAAEAAQHDPSIIDRVSQFSAAHPGLVKTLGAGALTVLLSHVARGQRH
jgi:hypothetical protein